jgi:hypothetical protein
MPVWRVRVPGARRAGLDKDDSAGNEADVAERFTRGHRTVVGRRLACEISGHEVVVGEVAGQPFSCGSVGDGSDQQFTADEGAAPGVAEAAEQFVAVAAGAGC